MPEGQKNTNRSVDDVGDELVIMHVTGKHERVGV